MALRKVKGNLERMFDKNLTDLVRGIRNNKENEVNILKILEVKYLNYLAGGWNFCLICKYLKIKSFKINFFLSFYS